MDLNASPGAMLKAILPKVPLILKTAALHSLSLSETSSKWDLSTEIIINVLRAFVSGRNPATISQAQRRSIKDPGVKGNVWVSRYTIPKPEEDGDIRQLVFKAIDQLSEGGEVYSRPDLQPVYTEWTGYRADAKPGAPEPAISEDEKYQELLKEVTSDTVILYFHGGAYYMMDPASHRHVTSRLAKLTGGRVLSVRYRLAPQNPFPSALLDSLLSYLALLYPPPGSPHSAVPASKIVFSGDSAGGNLALVLLQLILQIHRAAGDGQTPTVKFNGTSVALSLPGGTALNSPWTDVTRAMPSIETNAKYDYLPPSDPDHFERIPPCPIWPADPPRADFYCNGNAMCHPLVSPMAAMDWKGSPPIFVACGEEMLADEAAVLMQRIARQGTPVVWEQYEAMPHCFALLFENMAGAVMCFDGWATFCTDVTDGKKEIETRGTFITAKKLEKSEVDVTKLLDYEDSDILEMMKIGREKRREVMDKDPDHAVPKL